MPLMFQIRPPRNPLLRLLMAVAGMIVLGMFTIVGVFVAALLLAAFSLRQLWLRANGRASTGPERQPRGHQPKVIEGEFTVVGKVEERLRRR
jgi:hypothetical protein